MVILLTKYFFFFWGGAERSELSKSLNLFIFTKNKTKGIITDIITSSGFESLCQCLIFTNGVNR